MLAQLLTGSREMPLAMARTCWAPGILWICRVRVSVVHTDTIEPATSLVYVSNHQSYLDIPILFTTLPHNLYFVAKQELRKVPLLGWYMAATGMIFIDRSNPRNGVRSLRRAAELIKTGKSVILFPEGTRNPAPALTTFKKGPFTLAHQAGTAILPVGINTDRPLALSTLSRVHATVTTGAPVLLPAKPDTESIDRIRQTVGELSGKATATAGAV